ncbi:uncharacterized protein [Argopecten irradians]|uniref:uncharacterized protein n=1 Tax=Argopecten irradians TaxID=31199 RepID=UPI0037224649
MSDPLISSQLNDVLDSYGLSKTFIDYRRIVFNCFCIDFSNVTDDELMIHVGSKRDAVCSILDTESDIDAVFIEPVALFDEGNLNSAKKFASTPNGLKTPVIILETGTHPGYKYLKCLANEKEEYMYTQFKGSTYLLNTTKQVLYSKGDSEPEPEVHGPALSDSVFIGGESLHIQVDLVLGFHCPSLPKDFDEWCKRKRNYNWPPSWVIEATKRYGCFVVGVGHPNSDTQAIEWRLSLSKTEYLLTKSFNHVQMKCYVLMKLVMKWIMQPQVKEPLTSYHVKTVMFWMSEEQERQFWRPENLAVCFRSSLMKLKMFVENKRCPNYFITDVNLLEGKLEGEIYHRVLEVFDNIIREGPKVVFQCLPLNFRLNPSRCQHRNNPCCKCLHKRIVVQRIEEMKSIDDKMDILLTNSETDADNFRRSQFSLIDWYLVNEIQNKSMLHTHAFTSLSVLEKMVLPNKVLYALQNKYLAKLRGNGHVSRIKMATYFYYRRRLGYCIPILSLVIKSMESSQEFELCTEDEASASDVTEIEGVECIYLTQNKKGFKVSEIVFNPCDKRLIPPDLQDEMGRPKTVNGIHYEGWVFVDSIVYAYYLLIVTLHDMRRYSGIVSLFRRFRKVVTQQSGTIRIFRRDMAERLYDHASMLVWVATKGFTKLSE